MLARIVMFLLGAVLDFISVIFLLRFLMQWLRVSFAGPMGAFVLALSDWAVRPLRRVLPGLLGLDWASLLPVVFFQLVLLVLSQALLGGYAMGGDILVAALVDTLRMGVWVMVFALLGAAVLSWVNPYSPLAAPLAQLTRPVLRPIQRWVRPISGFDLSPLVAILLAQVLLMVLDAFKAGLLGGV